MGTSNQRSITKLLIAAMFAALFYSIGAPASAAESGTSAQPVRTEWNQADIVPGKVLVKYKRGAAERSLDVSAQRRNIGPSLVALSFPGGVDVAAKIAELEQDPNVEYAEPVFKTFLIEPIRAEREGDAAAARRVYTGPEEYMQYWGQHATEVEALRQVTAPEALTAVTVAVLDSGIDAAHPDLAGAVVPGYDFINDDEDPADDNGHGTHVAGIIGASAAAEGGYTGAAPGVKLMPLKVLDNEGNGDTEGIVEAIQYASAQGADIINLSLGFPIYSRIVHETVKGAVAEGILVIAASGNDSNHWIYREDGQLDELDEAEERYAFITSYPALLDEVVSVGAAAKLTEEQYTLADFSNVGNVDIVAPGVDIYSTIPGGSYAYYDGTSMAAPLVTGIAALLKANYPALPGGDLREVLKASGSLGNVNLTHINYSGDGIYFLQPDEKSLRVFPRTVDERVAYGYGLVNAREAMEDPYVRIDYVSDDLDGEATVTMDITMVSLDQVRIDGDDRDVALVVNAYDEDSLIQPIGRWYAFKDGALTDGAVRLTVDVGDPDDVYYYHIFAVWGEDGEYRTSNMYEFVRRPATPTANLVTDTYVGTQTVTLTTETEGAEILYVIIDRVNLGSVSGTVESGGTVSIDKTSLLILTSKKNKVYSDGVGMYWYDIQPAGGDDGGGDGGDDNNDGGDGGDGGNNDNNNGGVISGPPVVILPPADPNHVVVQPDKTQLLNEVAGSAPSVTIKAEAKSEQTITVKIDADVFEKADELGKPIIIEASCVSFTLPAGALGNELSGIVELVITPSDREVNVPNARAIAGIYDFKLTADGQPVTAFEVPIEAAFELNTAAVNEHQLGVFTYNEEAGAWQYVGGKPAAEGKFATKLPHFSVYTVLQLNKTFTDIRTHWARMEIEALAARGIVTGMTESTYEPGGIVTRAQIASLISRMLGLDETAGTTRFSDVESNVWYAGAVQAVAAAGIMQGVDSEQFAPSEELTREQFAVLALNTYLTMTGKTLADIAVTQELKFSDEGLISPWARQAVRTVDALGIMQGDGGKFNPKAVVTRDQAAAVLYRLMELA